LITAKYCLKCTVFHVDLQSQCKWNCQNLSITPTTILTLPVSVTAYQQFQLHWLWKSRWTAVQFWPCLACVDNFNM
jgi:hypothetical protein